MSEKACEHGNWIISRCVECDLAEAIHERDSLRAELNESNRNCVRLAALVSTERYRTQQWRAVAEQILNASDIRHTPRNILTDEESYALAAYEKLKGGS